VGEQVFPAVHHKVRVGSWSRLDVLWRCVGHYVCDWVTNRAVGRRGGGGLVPRHVVLKAKEKERKME
jgi:hypothetical protein